MMQKIEIVYNPILKRFVLTVGLYGKTYTSYTTQHFSNVWDLLQFIKKEMQCTEPLK